MSSLRKPIAMNSNSLCDFRIGKLKGTNKPHSNKWPGLSISSQYIGRKDDKFGMFTTKVSPKIMNRIILKGPKAFSQFSNKKISSLLDNTPEQYHKFKQIAIDDVYQMKKDQLLQAMLWKLTFKSRDSPRPIDSFSSGFFKGKKSKYLSIRSYENLNCSNTYSLKILSESELIERNKENSNQPKCALSSSSSLPNQNQKIPITIPRLIKQKSYSSTDTLLRNSNQLNNSNNIKDESRLISSQKKKISSNFNKTIHGFYTLSIANGGSRTARK